MQQRFLIPGILSLIALFWLYLAITEYGIWDEGPLGGFLPMLASVMTIVFSVASMFRPAGKSKPWVNTVFIPVVIVIVLIGLINLLGMLPALLVMLFCWLKFLEKYPLGFSIILSVCVTAAVFGIFQAWLKVPFPHGMLF